MLFLRWTQLLVPSQQPHVWRCCAAVFNSTQAVSPGIAATVDPELENAKSYDEMPGRKGVLGVLQMMKDFLPFIGKFDTSKPLSLSELNMELYREYGPIIRMDAPGYPHGIVYVIAPDDVRKVFSHEGRYPWRDLMPSLGKSRQTRPDLFPNTGLLSENMERWHNIRSKVQVPMMKPQITETYIPKMVAVSDEFVERIQSLRDDKGEVPNFLNELYKWALESTGLVAFNTRLGCLSKESSSPDSEAQRMIQATINSFEVLLELELKNPWKMFSSYKKEKSKLASSQEYILSVATKYCNLTLESMSRSTDAKNEDFGVLGEILQRGDLDIRDIRTFALDLLMAGIETTAHTAGFALYLFARNMAEQEKVVEEIHRVLPTPETPITPKVVHQLNLVRASVKETMRLLPTVDGTMRILDHDIALGGYRVPAGINSHCMEAAICSSGSATMWSDWQLRWATLFLGTQIASLLPQNFPEADKFLPERWLSPTKPHPYSNLPFGHGPRSCIGRRIALQELHLLVIKLLRKYRIEYHHGDIRRISRLVNLPDKPLRFSFVDRK